MLRSICAVLGFAAPVTPAPPDVAAVTLAKAFKAGQADQFKNKQISGTGVSFHGAIKGADRRRLDAELARRTLGALAANASGRR
jgi:hypothetical protein